MKSAAYYQDIKQYVDEYQFCRIQDTVILGLDG